GAQNMVKLLKKIFGDGNQRQLNRTQKLVDEIESLEDKFEAYSDIQLREKTEEYKERYQKGETLEDLMPEAYATVREGAKRVLKIRHFSFKLVRVIRVHKGNIAEMKTGEGKTLASTMSVYLNALTGNGVHIVTVNEYLADRDAEDMGQLYEFLGLTAASNRSDMNKEE